MEYFAHFGHDQRLSSAEIHAIFGLKASSYSKLGCRVEDNSLSSQAQFLGGIPKVSLILAQVSTFSQAQECILADILKKPSSQNEAGVQESESKYPFSLAFYDCRESAFVVGLRLKKQLQQQGSFRLVNKDASPIHTAVYKKEFQKRGGEWNCISLGNQGFLITRTVFVQDIDAYSARDFGKIRDTKVGMLPPKLAQIFLNLASSNLNTIFDPFCGLGTILLEAGRNPRWKKLLAADRATSMVLATKNNFQSFFSQNPSHAIFDAFEADATLPWIHIPQEDYCIVTEGYLGNLMTAQVPDHLLAEESKKLAYLYDTFLFQASKVPQVKEIIFTAPAWRLRTGETLEVQGIEKSIVNHGWQAVELFPDSPITRYNILRENQKVGRMLRKLVRKEKI